MEIQIFLLVFFVMYLVSALVLYVLHLIMRREMKNYRVSTIIFSLLVALAVTLVNIGR
ncbi:hypothetical protein IT415_03940 [bacterium]|nr:hypothetical protein [bacterium]